MQLRKFYCASSALCKCLPWFRTAVDCTQSLARDFEKFQSVAPAKFSPTSWRVSRLSKMISLFLAFHGGGREDIVNYLVHSRCDYLDHLLLQPPAYFYKHWRDDLFHYLSLQLALWTIASNHTFFHLLPHHTDEKFYNSRLYCSRR